VADNLAEVELLGHPFAEQLQNSVGRRARFASRSLKLTYGPDFRLYPSHEKAKSQAAVLGAKKRG